MFGFYFMVGFLLFLTSIFISIVLFIDIEEDDDNRFIASIIIGSWVLFFILILTDLSLHSHTKDEVRYEVEVLDSGTAIIVDGDKFVNINKELGKNIEDGTVIIKTIENYNYPIAPDQQEIRYTLYEND